MGGARTTSADPGAHFAPEFCTD